MAKSANFHSPKPATPTTAVQEIMIKLEKHGAEQLQEKMTIATPDALEQVHVRPRSRPSVQHEGHQVHIHFDCDTNYSKHALGIWICWCSLFYRREL